MPEGVPQNAGFMVAAYVATGVILLSYALSLYRRGRGGRGGRGGRKL